MLWFIIESQVATHSLAISSLITIQLLRWSSQVRIVKLDNDTSSQRLKAWPLPLIS